jgi:leucyl-tRNA synthetase
MTIPVDADEAAMQSIAMASEKVQADLAGKTVRKVIIVPGKLVNIVAG